MQDPWYSDYYETHPHATPPPKYALARRVHRVLEPWTMARVDGLVSVSLSYLNTLCRRYPRLTGVPKATITFGASPSDFALLARHPQPNRSFVPSDGHLHGVYVGRGGDDVAPALGILFLALQHGRKSAPDLFNRVRLHFIGTDYASKDRARKTIAPVASKAGVGDFVTEDTTRLPYFETLQALTDADFLIVIGSDDPSYTPSKIYPYILAQKPIVAVLHEQSSAVKIVQQLNAGCVVELGSDGHNQDAAVRKLADGWQRILEGLPTPPAIDWQRFAPYSAREMTKRQCELFDAVHARAMA